MERKKKLDRENVKKFILFFLNPRLLFCFGLAWLVTNGWAYIMLGFGTYLEVAWMIGISGAYLTIIWLPISPEKIVTVAITMALLRFLFPNDQKTLAVLHDFYVKIKTKKKKQKKKRNKEKDALVLTCETCKDDKKEPLV